MPVFHYTDRQLEIEKLINKAGFRTQLEVPAGQYCIDLLIPELDDLIVEVQGPQHYKKATERREADLRELGYKYFVYVPVTYTDQEFLQLFHNKLVEFFGVGLKGY
jgi:hypothetical protein